MGWRGRTGPAAEPESLLPPIAEVLGRATVLGSRRQAPANLARASLVVRLPPDGTGLLAFDRIDTLVAAGRRAAEAALAGAPADLLAGPRPA